MDQRVLKLGKQFFNVDKLPNKSKMNIIIIIIINRPTLFNSRSAFLITVVSKLTNVRLTKKLQKSISFKHTKYKI